MVEDVEELRVEGAGRAKKNSAPESREWVYSVGLLGAKTEIPVNLSAILLCPNGTREKPWPRELNLSASRVWRHCQG
jgi:hypothetical protein